MTQGVVLFASNNGSINYIKQAVYSAKRIKKYMNLPTTLITNAETKNLEELQVFDKIINYEEKAISNKIYKDGDYFKKTLPFLNASRPYVYELSPYDETLVLDTDFIVSNNILNLAFDSISDFQIYKNATHIGTISTTEFDSISDTSVEFYWATAFFFRKTTLNKIFFDLIKHIQENYLHYRSVYQFTTHVFRNDFAFSIAIHIINGYTKGNFASELPGKHFYAIDRDILHSICDNEIKVLIEKPDHLGEYLLISLQGSNLHIMNKFSLDRIINIE